MSLYVGNLHPDVTESCLFKVFLPFGQIRSVKVCKNFESNKPLGYGYVNFEKDEDADKAIEALNYKKVNGQCIRVMKQQRKLAKDLHSSNLVVKNLSPDFDEKQLKKEFSVFGDILSVKIAKDSKFSSKGYGFVQFAEKEAADWAAISMHGKEIRGKKLSICKYIPADERKLFKQNIHPNNVFIQNLSSSFSIEELFNLCESFGDIVSVKLATDSCGRRKGYGFVSFKQANGALKAVSELNKLFLNGRKVIAVRVKSDECNNRDLVQS